MVGKTVYIFDSVKHLNSYIMKTKFYYLVVLLLAIGMSSMARVKDGQALSGNSHTDLGKYSIVKSKVPMVVNDQVLDTYELVYENAAKPVQIGIVNEKKCTTFLVRSDEIEVQYMCQKGVFGVKKMDKKYRQLDENRSDSKMDRVNYLSQRVITKNSKTEKELLGLIACYFPVLVEKQYQAQL